MAIKGWTDGDTRLPRLGNIGLGVKKGGEKSHPVAVDYFVLPDDVQQSLEELMGLTTHIQEETKAIEIEKVELLRMGKGATQDQKKAMAKEIEEKKYKIIEREQALADMRKIRELDVVLPDDNIEAIMPAWLKRYNSNGLICKGDGERAGVSKDYIDYLFQNDRTEYGLRCTNGTYLNQNGEVVPVEVRGGKEWLQVECNTQTCPFYNNPDAKKKSCREVAILSVILSKLPGVLGVYSIDTGSFNSYQNIKNSLQMLRKMLGRVSMVPLKLRVKMQYIKKFNRNVPVLYLDFGNMSLEQVIEMAQKNQLTAKVAQIGNAGNFKMEDIEEDHAPELLYGESEEVSQPVEPMEDETSGNVSDSPVGPEGTSKKDDKGQLQEGSVNETKETTTEKEQPKQTDQSSQSQNTNQQKTTQESGESVQFKVCKMATVNSAKGTPLLRMIVEANGQSFQVVAPQQEGVVPGKEYKALLVNKAGHQFAERLEAVS